jgi:hypothetical protein
VNVGSAIIAVDARIRDLDSVLLLPLLLPLQRQLLLLLLLPLQPLPKRPKAVPEELNFFG